MLGDPLLRLEETDSTNRVALDWDDAPAGACVVARSQSGGRGRLGRPWESAPGKGLYFSLVLRPAMGANWTFFSPLTALCIVKTLELSLELPLSVKWPNDLICLSKTGQARKFGGILCEARGEKLVIGVGINLNQSAGELPTRPIFPATSLHLESGDIYNLDGVFKAILPDLDSSFEEYGRCGWAHFEREFRRKCLGIGEVVRVQTEAETLLGVFEGIGENGALLLKTAAGMRPVLAGDVSYF